MSKKVCRFHADLDSCQATEIMRCIHCGSHKGNPWHQKCEFNPDRVDAALPAHTDHPMQHWDRTCPACNSDNSEQPNAHLVSAGQTRASKTRTPQDFAIEHAEYMATAAEQLCKAANDLAEAYVRREERDGDGDNEDISDALESFSVSANRACEYVYEFRKRRDRAVEGLQETKPQIIPDSSAALRQRVQELEAALNEIASWSEGEVVGSHFDEPGAAEIARAALLKEPKS